MLKSELIHKIAAHLPKLAEHHIALAVNQLITIIIDMLKNKYQIEIRDFGKFSTQYRRSQSANNPKTGKKIIAGARYRTHFKPGKGLRDKVNNLTTPS